MNLPRLSTTTHVLITKENTPVLKCSRQCGFSPMWDRETGRSPPNQEFWPRENHLNPTPFHWSDPELFPHLNGKDGAQTQSHPSGSLSGTMRPTRPPLCPQEQREPWRLTRSRSNRMNSSPDTKVRKRVRWSWLQTRAFLRDTGRGEGSSGSGYQRGPASPASQLR